MCLYLESLFAIGCIENETIIWTQILVNAVLPWLMEMLSFHLKNKIYIPIIFSLANAIIRYHFKMTKSDSSGSMM